MTSKIMELAENYAVSRFSDGLNDRNGSEFTKVGRTALQTAVTKLEAENARLERELARKTEYAERMDALSKQEPFWYAVISKKAPIVNKAIRRVDVANEYAEKCHEYPGVEVVPLYRAAGAKEQP